MFLRTLAALLVLSWPAWAQPVAVPDCTADVTLAAGLKLDVQYRCRSDSALIFEPVGRVEPKSGLVEARYQMDLKARRGEGYDLIVQGDGALATLGTFLAEPRGYDRAPTIDIRVHAAEGLVFSSGLPKVGDAWRLAGAPLRFAGYAALGKLSLQEIVVPAPGSLRAGAKREDGVLRLAILDGASESGRADLADWVKRTAEAEANYWQGFTAKQMLVGLVPRPLGRAVGYGRAVSSGGASIMVEVDSAVDRRRLFDAWVLVHELIHTGMPFVRRGATWFMEGAATYVEPIVRARAGWKTEEEAWKEWVTDMPQGAAAFGRGLSTASGRENYWAGAIFMLMADIAIRRESAGRMGLEDCLGGALWSGLDATRVVGVQEYAQACDKATGTTAMSGLVGRYYTQGEPVDLGKLWKELGVALVAGRIVLDDAAPLAPWRKTIVMGPPGRPARPVKLPWQS